MTALDIQSFQLQKRKRKDGEGKKKKKKIILPARCSTNLLEGMLPLQVSLLIILEAEGGKKRRRRSRVVKLACARIFSVCRRVEKYQKKKKKSTQRKKEKKRKRKLSNLNLLSVQAASLCPAPLPTGFYYLQGCNWQLLCKQKKRQKACWDHAVCCLSLSPLLMTENH